MHNPHKHAHRPTLLSSPTVKSEFPLLKPWVYPTQTPSLLSPIRKCINMQSEGGHPMVDCFSSLITAKSAGSHFTVSNSFLESQRAASCSFKCSVSINSEQR